LDKHEFEENKDFTNRKVVVRGNSGMTYQNNYLITPKCFKAILLKCTKNKKFI